MEKQGIKELKEMVDLVIGLANAGVKIGKDKKVDVTDLSHLLGLIPLIQPAFDGVTKLPAEVMDLSGAEGAELIAHVGASLSVDSERAKAIITASVKLAMDIKVLVDAIKIKDAPKDESVVA